jgi:phenylacetate-coenzyme A ligase PaaK-like adenylate-forming protein
MPSYHDWIDLHPYAMEAKDKNALLVNSLLFLTKWHQSHCEKYRDVLSILDKSSIDKSIVSVEEIPYLPVRLFKEYELISVSKEEIFKIMTSSGTTGQSVSRIYLDKETASLQTKVLSRLMAEVLGKKRLPMLIFDSPSILKNRLSFSARGAGILGFSLFGQDVTYAFDENMDLDLYAIENFLNRHIGQKIFLFGFTYMIWQYFVQKLQEMNVRLSIENGILLHGGGWKKLLDQAVDNEVFKKILYNLTGISKVHNYYGMVEQTGSIYLECEHGFFHCPIYADVVMRDSKNFNALGVGIEGIIEVISLIPRSYPGHALLTEDMGTLIGEDNCKCGRKGKYFTVTGRIPKAEVRGCSDTFSLT